MEFGLDLPMVDGKVDIGRLTMKLSNILSGNPEEFVCITSTSDKSVADQISNYISSSYDFNATIIPKKDENGYLIKFEAQI